MIVLDPETQTRKSDLYRVKVLCKGNCLKFDALAATFGAVRSSQGLVLDPNGTQILRRDDDVCPPVLKIT